MRKILTGITIALTLFPAISAAQGAGSQNSFQRQGIFDCNQIAGQGQSIGAMAGSGIYVPVNDAAVTLNTGILVYKECVLREVVDREREAATSAFFRKIYTGIETGRGGSAMYVKSKQEILTSASDPAMLKVLEDGTLKALDPSIQSPASRTIARKYQNETGRGNKSILTCPYAGNLRTFQAGKAEFSFKGLMAGTAPQCNPVIATIMASEVANSRVAACIEYMRDQWNWGEGFYARTEGNNPCEATVVTPAAVVRESFQTMLDSPVRQLESANDIGQMIGALYAGLTTQVVTSAGGLSGLSQSSGGQPSYLDQVSRESSAGVRNAAANAAINILNAARQVEGAYLQTINAIGNALTQAIGQLRSAENQCWNLIVPKVCSAAPAADGTCTDAAGASYKVATTSERFAQKVIDAQIAPLASSTLANIATSQKAVSLIDQLIAGVTNTNSLDAQRVSLLQLDALVASRSLHTQSDLQTIRQQLQEVQGSLTGESGLVSTTVKNWADSTDPAIGWCNVNNQAVIDGWKQKWRK